MKKKIFVLLVVLLLLASTIQVAFADPPGPVLPSCNMVNSWWEPGEGPGNANGVEPGHRGLFYVHDESHPGGSTNGTDNMFTICP